MEEHKKTRLSALRGMLVESWLEWIHRAYVQCVLRQIVPRVHDSIGEEVVSLRATRSRQSFQPLFVTARVGRRSHCNEGWGWCRLVMPLDTVNATAELEELDEVAPLSPFLLTCQLQSLEPLCVRQVGYLSDCLCSSSLNAFECQNIARLIRCPRLNRKL